jgi:hypothetical protein
LDLLQDEHNIYIHELDIKRNEILPKSCLTVRYYLNKCKCPTVGMLHGKNCLSKEETDVSSLFNCLDELLTFFLHDLGCILQKEVYGLHVLATPENPVQHHVFRLSITNKNGRQAGRKQN